MRVRINDTDYEELQEIFNPEDIPTDPTEARQAIENFVDLEILMRPLQLPSPGDSSFKQPSSNFQEPSSPPLPLTESTQEVQGRDLGTGFERR